MNTSNSSPAIVSQWLSGAAILGLINLIVISFFYYSNLPDQIPIHYGFSGEPDHFSTKKMVFFMPLIGLFLWSLLYYLKDKPEGLNYPVAITADNSKRIYAIGTQMIQFLNVVLIILFNYINYVTIQTAMGLRSGLGPNFAPMLIGGLFVFLGSYIWRFKRVK